MKRPTYQLAFVALLACKPSEHVEVPSPASSPLLAPVEGAESYERPPPAPAELDVEQVIKVIQEAHVSIADVQATQQFEYHGGRWYDIVVFTTGGAMYCRMVSSEADQDDCEHDPESGPYVPLEAEDLVGVAVVSYSDPKVPRFERARFLFGGCEADNFGSCGEPDEILEDGGEGGSVAEISVERLEVADVDGDGAPEVVLETSHVTLDENYEFTGPSEEIREYYEESYAQRRLTVLRPNLSRQLDAIVGQEMLPSILGMYADRDIAAHEVSLTPEGVTATWCEIEMNSGAHLRRNCLEKACASPTTTIQMPYDFGTDSYGPATVQQLRPALESCE